MPKIAATIIAAAQAVIVDRLPDLLEEAFSRHGVTSYQVSRAQVRATSVAVAPPLAALCLGVHGRRDLDAVARACHALVDGALSRSRIMMADHRGKRCNAVTHRDAIVRWVTASLTDAVTPLYRGLISFED